MKNSKENIDANLPPRNFATGRLHPISQTTYKIIEIFGNMGFRLKVDLILKQILIILLH